MKINCHKRMIEYIFHRLKEDIERKKRKMEQNGIERKKKRRNQKKPIKGYEEQSPILKLQIEKCRGKRRSPMSVLER